MLEVLTQRVQVQATEGLGLGRGEQDERERAVAFMVSLMLRDHFQII